MVITLSFNFSKEGVSGVHFVTGEHLLITHRPNKVLLAILNNNYDGAVNDLYLKAHGHI